MKRYRLETTGGRQYFVVSGKKDQQIDQSVADRIKDGSLRGFLGFAVRQGGRTVQLEYDVSGRVALRDYLSFPINRKRFAALLKSSFEVISSLKKLYFDSKRLLLQPEYVFIEPASGTASFVYVPLLTFEEAASAKEYYLGLVYGAVFAPNENVSYLKEYMEILNSGANFSEFDLEQYIAGLPDASPAKEMRQEISPPVPVKEKQADKRALHERTEGGDDLSPYPYLIREKTAEKILINKPCFRIGKQRDKCDYTVEDNATVSRNHAEIITRSGVCFVVDNGSTNGTYINGKAVASESETELPSGAKLRFSNEGFIFFAKGKRAAD